MANKDKDAGEDDGRMPKKSIKPTAIKHRLNEEELNEELKEWLANGTYSDKHSQSNID